MICYMYHILVTDREARCPSNPVAKSILQANYDVPTYYTLNRSSLLFSANYQTHKFRI